MGLHFDWDPAKASQNERKHQVSFQEAASVFADSWSATIVDPDHSQDEERYLIIGYSNQRRLLIVSYTERGTTIRIISARRLTAAEREQYEESS